MIARVWSGRTKPENAEAYAQVVHTTGIADLEKTPGNLGTLLLRRIDGTEAEFTLISLWESEEHIKAFAGQNLEIARYYPEDDAYLLEKPEWVTHSEVVHLSRKD